MTKKDTEYPKNTDAFDELNFDMHPAQVYCKDQSGQYIYVNLAIEKDYQCSAEQFIGLPIEQTPFQLFASAYNHSDQQTWQQGHIECIEPMLIGGKITAGLADKMMLLDRHGHPIGVLSFTQQLHDINWPDGDYNKPVEIVANNFILKHYFHGISLRESEVLYLMLRGSSGPHIAKTLSLSARTIETYIDNMKHRLKVKSKSQLIEKAFDMGFVFFTPERFKRSTTC